jgi:hypothetical protein
MADIQHGSPVLGGFTHFLQAFVLEINIPNGEDLVDCHDFCFQVRGDREREPDVHPRRIPLHLSLEKTFDTRKFDDLIKPSLDFLSPHAEE